MSRDGLRAQRDSSRVARGRVRSLPSVRLSLAWRESRASARRGLLIVLSVAIGVGALVAINSFTDNLRESVQREARALLGADLALSAASPFPEAAEALLARGAPGDEPRRPRWRAW